jgi:hypothetical protein
MLHVEQRARSGRVSRNTVANSHLMHVLGLEKGSFAARFIEIDVVR